VTLPARKEPAASKRLTVKQYLALTTRGVLAEEDRVELLEGVVVAMAPRTARHDAAVNHVFRALLRAVGSRATLRCQSSLVLPPASVPEPDVVMAVGDDHAYDHAHPTDALLVVEVAESSLPQDRLTKAAIYAARGVQDYWIVNLRDDTVEIRRRPDRRGRRYRRVTTARRGDTIDLAAFTDVRIEVDSLLPDR